MMHLRLRGWCGAVVGACVLGGSLGGAAPASAQGAMPEWARQRTQAWYAAFGAGDSAAMGRLYASDAVLLLQGQVFVGRAEIEAFHKGNFEQARFNCTWNVLGVVMVDRLASVWGDDTCADTPKAGGPPVDWKGRWLMVYQRQPDDSWIIVRDSGEEAR